MTAVRCLPAPGHLLAVWLVALMLAASLEATANMPSESLLVAPELRCPDGRIPLNSPQTRCRSQPQLQWTGRRCENNSRDFGCPQGFDCLAGGICCETPEHPQYADLCRMSWAGSKAIDRAGSCWRDSDCAGFDSLASRCCSGTCVLLKQRCFKQRRQYFNILSTGKVPRLYMPRCTDDGAYQAVQWEPRHNRRWCVDQRTGLALRSGCCLASNNNSAACSNPRPCPPDLCALSVCPARPDAACRVSVCDSGDCRAEFFDQASGQPVNCGAGLSRCLAAQAAYFAGLAFLRARDQTQWLQTDASHHPATRDSNLAAFMDSCQPDECRAYEASLLEPAAAPSYGYYYQDCPKQDQLNYRCRDRCSGFAGCPWGQKVCCNSGCGLECMTPADIKPVWRCSMSISSGYCPAVGCYRMCRRWGYDPVRKLCRPFWYAGSGGNNNRYNSWAECEWMSQNCHGRVRIALPVRPSCAERSGEFDSVQMSDNGMFWCVNRDGEPTPGTLHADRIKCTRDGRIVKNKYYMKMAYMYKATCPNGAPPAWCHNKTVDRTCGSPGVTTFADACNNCRLVHINANGEEVSCQPDSDACAASSSPSASSRPSIVACESAPTRPNFRYSPDTGRCSAECPVSGSSGYSRESGCLSACASGWCGKNSTAFYPDLCVSPSCPAWPGAICVPDECSGRERYFLPNGTELTACARQLAALQPTDTADCGSSPASRTTLEGMVTGDSRPTTAGRVAEFSTTTPTGKVAGASTSTTAGRVAGASTTSPSGKVAGASTTSPSGKVGEDSTTSPSGKAAEASTTSPSGKVAGASTTYPSGKVAGASTTSIVENPATSSTSKPTAGTSNAPETKPPPKSILPICRIRLHLGIESMRCRATDGRYEAKQCNLTHCFCVTIDSGAPLSDPRPVSLVRGASLACPIVETTNLSVTITYDADYMTVLPTMEDEEKLQRIVTSRFAYEGGLEARHIRMVDLEPGSILVTVGMEKTPGDSTADLPASAFELKTMALKRTLTLDYNGVTLTPSAGQSFNENSGSSVVKQPVDAALTGGGDGGSGGQLNVAGIVAGVLITVAVVAVAGVLIAFACRRAKSGGSALPPETANYNYETMSNASQSSGGGGGYDNFANKVYGSPEEEDVYDNIAQPVASNA